MANQDRVNFVWAESALTTIPPIPVSEVAYRDTTQTPEQMEVGQQYDTIYNSARHNQLLFLLTSVAKTLCENGIMPFLAGQEYSQYARCIFTDGKLYTASRAILANEQPYPTPGDDSGVWIAEETSEKLVPNSRRVIAGTGLTGGGPLSSDVTLSAKLDGKTTQAAADGAITVKDVAIGGDLGDLASARGQIGNSKATNSHDFSSGMLSEKPGMYTTMKSGSTNVPFTGPFSEMILGSPTYRGSLLITSGRPTLPRAAVSTIDTEEGFSGYNRLITEQQIGDGLTVNNGIISVPEYEGATVSTAGTSGLVPPAAAGQHESFLTGGGEYKPALTKISDSVSLADSKTAASAKAVKTAYDRGTAGVTAANGKLSLSGGVMSGRIGGLRGNYNADASSRHVTGALEIRENGGVGNAQSDIAYAPTIGFHWANRVAGLLALRSDGIFSFMKQNGTRAVVDCDVPYATAANKLRREGGVDTSWRWSGQKGQPDWLWGGNDGVNMYVYNPANFSVNSANSANYANSAGSVSGLGGALVSGVVNRCGDEICVHAPAGGQYLVLYGQRVAVTNGRRGGELYVKLSPGIYAGGSLLGQTGDRENDDAHMVTYAGELYRV